VRLLACEHDKAVAFGDNTDYWFQIFPDRSTADHCSQIVDHRFIIGEHLKSSGRSLYAGRLSEEIGSSYSALVLNARTSNRWRFVSREREFE
jgi:hypothetical protein